jgi:DNA primase
VIKMGKLGLPVAKYVIRLEFKVNGVVDKSDVIGAIFGQTEGLLGSELELRDLQRSGRIGRIEVEVKNENGKSFGTITIPTSLDKVETAIIASALETVDKIGPSNAEIKVVNLEDVRLSKRLYIKERAKELLQDMINKVLPDSHELVKEIEEGLRILELREFGKEKLPAGPNLDEEEIILVEGRADVINLLKAGIKNVIGINGTNIPKSVIDLTKKKTTILFLDGDRGGDLILRALIEKGADIDYIVRAPVGKEVEELSKKEIYKALKNKIPLEQIKLEQEENIESEYSKIEKKEKETGLSDEVKEKFRKYLIDIVGTKNILLLDENLNILAQIPLREIEKIPKEEKYFAVVIDGIINKEIIKLLEDYELEYLVAPSKRTDSNKVKIITVNELE